MGLWVSHGCWEGPYSGFHWWRAEIARAAGIDLAAMAGFCDPRERSPIAWSSLAPDILHVLLNHPDDRGIIRKQDCGPLADRLEQLLPLLPQVDDPDWDSRPPTLRFVGGLRLAAARRQNVRFR